MAHFKAATVGQGGNAVIMGRKTWESIPPKFRPLPDRLNFVLTRNRDYRGAPAGYYNLEEALEEVLPNQKEVFIIGGAELYAEALRHPLCEQAIITRIQRDFECDTFLVPFEHDFFQARLHVCRDLDTPLIFGVEYWHRRP